MVKTPRFRCRGHWLDPRPGTTKKKKKEEEARRRRNTVLAHRQGSEPASGHGGRAGAQLDLLSPLPSIPRGPTSSGSSTNPSFTTMVLSTSSHEAALPHQLSPGLPTNLQLYGNGSKTFLSRQHISKKCLGMPLHLHTLGLNHTPACHHAHLLGALQNTC